MKIAQIAPPWFAVPPTGYGGIELVVSLLADGLTDRGHDVTLFASGGSQTKATLVSPLVDPPDPALAGQRLVRHVPCAFGVPRHRRSTSTSCTTTAGSPDPRWARCCHGGRRSCTRCTDRGPSPPRRYYTLLARARASRRDQRVATGRQPRASVRGGRAQRRRPRRLPVPQPRRTTSSSTSGAPIPTRARRSRSRSRAGPDCRWR